MLVRPRSVAELALAVIPPGPDRAVALESVRAVLAGREGRHVRDLHDPDRVQALCRRAVAELAVEITAPSPHGPVALKGDGMIVSGGDRDDARDPRDLGRPGDRV